MSLALNILGVAGLVVCVISAYLAARLYHSDAFMLLAFAFAYLVCVRLASFYDDWIRDHSKELAAVNAILMGIALVWIVVEGQKFRAGR
jgi:fucose 4-O-acetylase-like acetyltransferase